MDQCIVSARVSCKEFDISQSPEAIHPEATLERMEWMSNGSEGVLGGHETSHHQTVYGE